MSLQGTRHPPFRCLLWLGIVSPTARNEGRVFLDSLFFVPANIIFYPMNNNSKNLTFFKIISGVVLMLSFYLAWQIGQAIFYRQKYSIDFAAKNFGNQNLAFYIDENPQSFKFASFGQVGGKIYAQIQQTPLHFVFQPREFPLNKQITISALFKTEDDWDISLVCDQCPNAEKYSWQPFYRSQLNQGSYILAAFLDDLYVYAKHSQKWSKAKSIADWLEKNTTSDQIISAIVNKDSKQKIENCKNIIFKPVNRPDFVITDFYFKKEGAWAVAEKNFFLTPQAIKNAKNIRFALKSDSLNKKFRREKKIFDQGFLPLAKFNDNKLYGKKEITINTAADNLAAWLKKNIPATSSIYIDKNIAINYQDLKGLEIKSNLDSDFALLKDNNSKTFLTQIKIYVH